LGYAQAKACTLGTVGNHREKYFIFNGISNAWSIVDNADATG
jgi:hypothetical protein